MNGTEQSDSPIVPRKLANKGKIGDAACMYQHAVAPGAEVCNPLRSTGMRMTQERPSASG